MTTHKSAPRSKVRVFSLGMVLSFCLTAALGLTIIGWGASAASAQGIAISECNNAGSAVGTTISCTITVTNNFTYNASTPADPTGSATITTLIACTAPLVCGTAGTTTSVDPVTGITQCDASGLGGASTVDCTVSVTNNLTGYPTGAAIAPTVSQCLGSLLTTTVICAAVPPGNSQAGSGGPGGQSETECNSSGGPGGAMTCSATAPPSQATGLPTTIDQCNGSASAGASTVTCTVTIINNFVGSTAVLPGPIYPPPVTTATTLSTVPTTMTAASTSTTAGAGTGTTLTTVPATTTTYQPETTTTTPPTTTTSPQNTTTTNPTSVPAITATTSPSTVGSSLTSTVPGTTIPAATTTTIFPTMVVPLEKAGSGTTTTAAAATTTTTATATANWNCSWCRNCNPETLTAAATTISNCKARGIRGSGG